MNRKPELRGLAALLAGAVCIGFAPIWVRWSEVGPAATAAHRLIIALPFTALWALRECKGQALGWQGSELRWVLGAGLFFAVDLSAWHLSIGYTSVANATLLGNFAPIFVTLGAWLLLGERVGASFVAGMLVALAGAWLLTGASPGSDPQRLRGDVLGLATAAFYGAYQLCVARLRRTHGPGRILLASSLVSIPALAVIAVAFGEVLLPATLGGWAVLAGLAVTAQILGQGLITYGFAHLPAGYSSLTLLLQPVVAALAGWVLLGERLGRWQLLGAAVVMAGLVVARGLPRKAGREGDEPASSRRDSSTRDP